jgi:hypothetical protein
MTHQTFASIDDENRSGGALRLAQAEPGLELEGRYAFRADASGATTGPTGGTWCTSG